MSLPGYKTELLELCVSKKVQGIAPRLPLDSSFNLTCKSVFCRNGLLALLAVVHFVEDEQIPNTLYST